MNSINQAVQLLNQAIYDYTMFKSNSCEQNRKSKLNIVKVTMRIKAFSADLGEMHEPALETIEQFIERLVKKYLSN